MLRDLELMQRHVDALFTQDVAGSSACGSTMARYAAILADRDVNVSESNAYGASGSPISVARSMASCARSGRRIASPPRRGRRCHDG